MVLNAKILGNILVIAIIVKYVQNGPLTVQPFTFPTEVTKGQTVTVICAVLDGTGTFSFRWTKDGSPFKNHSSNRVPMPEEMLTKIQTLDEFSFLTLKSVDATRSGNYTCTVSNEETSGKHTAELFVYEQPEWMVMPSDLAITLGQNGQIECKANGVPSPTITWKKLEGTEETISPNVGTTPDSAHQSVASNGSLILRNVRLEDSGSYECTAKNGIGEELSKTVNVRINVSPQFREEFQLLKVRSSHSASLPCEVIGDDPLEVKWTKEYMTDSYETRQKIQETPLPNGLLSEFFIPRATRKDSGIYTCTAKNLYGHRQRTVKLIVLEPPSPPSDITVKHIGSSEVNIAWTIPYSGNSPVTRYVLQYWKDTGSPPKLEEEVIPSDQISVSLSGLHPGTPYVVRLIAENEFGQSTPSIPVKFTTSEENPSGYPTDIIVIPNGSDELVVQWKAPPPDQQNGVIRGYDLGYRKRHTSQSYGYKNGISIQHSDLPNENRQQEYVLDNLETGTEYEIVLRAYNSAGRGPLSVPIIARTREKGFLSTPVLWAEGASATTISLRWAVDGNKGKNFYYKLRYRIEHGQWEEKIFTNREQDSFVLTDLRESTNYEIFMLAVSNLDHSNPSPTIKVRTADPSSLRSSMSRDEESAHINTAAASTATLVISLSVVTSAVVIVCVVTIACVYVIRVKSRARQKAENENGSRHMAEQRSMSEMTRMSQSATNFRYVDVNSRPLLWCSTPAPPAEYPSPYATLPLRGTPLSKRWQGDADDITPEHSERSESLVNQGIDQSEEKASNCQE